MRQSPLGVDRTYYLPVGAIDLQGPHAEDEIYVIREGRGILRTESGDGAAVPGAALFVPAGEHHSLTEITESLFMHVIFSPAEGTNARAEKWVRPWRSSPAAAEGSELRSCAAWLPQATILLVYSQDDHHAAVTAERCTTETAKVVPYKCDIAAPGSAEVVFDGAAQLGVPVILVNNAGVTGRISSLADSDAEAIRHAVDVDLTATILLCREAMIRWTDAGRARQRSIVNLSSVAAKTGSPGEYVWYAAAKAGVNALTVGLAVEAAPHGIRVNAVSPGTTATTIHARAGRPDRATEVGARSPMGRTAQPEEIAAAVEWLVGPEASYVNGAILDVAGGTR